MIAVIVITGIIGGMVAMFLRWPVQGYTDSARRADMNDIADTALRRIARDVRTALPSSIRVTTAACPGGGAGTCDYLEFLPTTGAGRYRNIATGGGGGCAAAGDELAFGVADTCFEVLGPMPSFAAGDRVVMFNQAGDPDCDAYNPGVQPNRADWSSNTATSVTITSTILNATCTSPANRFQVISTPVSYVCDTAAQTLRRYSGYAIAAVQPTTGLAGGNLLASNVSTCSFSYNLLFDLLTLRLGITESGENTETVTLYHAVHVSNSSSVN